MYFGIFFVIICLSEVPFSIIGAVRSQSLDNLPEKGVTGYDDSSCVCLKWTHWISLGSPHTLNNVPHTYANLLSYGKAKAAGIADICAVPVSSECRILIHKDEGRQTESGYVSCPLVHSDDASNYGDVQIKFLCWDYDCPCLLWSKWYNYDGPSDDGDIEILGETIKREDWPCPQGTRPVDVDCRTAEGDEISKTGDKMLHCDLDGFRCLNRQQAKRCTCHDYMVRFLCLAPSARSVGRYQEGRNAPMPRKQPATKRGREFGQASLHQLDRYEDYPVTRGVKQRTSEDWGIGHWQKDPRRLDPDESYALFPGQKSGKTDNAENILYFPGEYDLSNQAVFYRGQAGGATENADAEIVLSHGETGGDFHDFGTEVFYSGQDGRGFDLDVLRPQRKRQPLGIYRRKVPSRRYTGYRRRYPELLPIRIMGYPSRAARRQDTEDSVRYGGQEGGATENSEDEIIYSHGESGGRTDGLDQPVFYRGQTGGNFDSSIVGLQRQPVATYKRGRTFALQPLQPSYERYPVSKTRQIFSKIKGIGQLPANFAGLYPHEDYIRYGGQSGGATENADDGILVSHGESGGDVDRFGNEVFYRGHDGGDSDSSFALPQHVPFGYYGRKIFGLQPFYRSYINERHPAILQTTQRKPQRKYVIQDIEEWIPGSDPARHGDSRIADSIVASHGESGGATDMDHAVFYRGQGGGEFDDLPSSNQNQMHSRDSSLQSTGSKKTGRLFGARPQPLGRRRYRIGFGRIDDPSFDVNKIGCGPYGDEPCHFSRSPFRSTANKKLNRNVYRLLRRPGEIGLRLRNKFRYEVDEGNDGTVYGRVGRKTEADGGIIKFHGQDGGKTEDSGQGIIAFHGQDGGRTEDNNSGIQSFHGQDDGKTRHAGTGIIAFHGQDGGKTENEGSGIVAFHGQDGGKTGDPQRGIGSYQQGKKDEILPNRGKTSGDGVPKARALLENTRSNRRPTPAQNSTIPKDVIPYRGQDGGKTFSAADGVILFHGESGGKTETAGDGVVLFHGETGGRTESAGDGVILFHGESGGETEDAGDGKVTFHEDGGKIMHGMNEDNAKMLPNDKNKASTDKEAARARAFAGGPQELSRTPPEDLAQGRHGFDDSYGGKYVRERLEDSIAFGENPTNLHGTYIDETLHPENAEDYYFPYQETEYEESKATEEIAGHSYDEAREIELKDATVDDRTEALPSESRILNTEEDGGAHAYRKGNLEKDSYFDTTEPMELLGVKEKYVGNKQRKYSAGEGETPQMDLEELVGDLDYAPPPMRGMKDYQSNLKSHLASFNDRHKSYSNEDIGSSAGRDSIDFSKNHNSKPPQFRSGNRKREGRPIFRRNYDPQQEHYGWEIDGFQKFLNSPFDNSKTARNFDMGQSKQSRYDWAPSKFSNNRESRGDVDVGFDSVDRTKKFTRSRKFKESEDGQSRSSEFERGVRQPQSRPIQTTRRSESLDGGSKKYEYAAASKYARRIPSSDPWQDLYDYDGKELPIKKRVKRV